jgi:hypothetical protein
MSKSQNAPHGRGGKSPMLNHEVFHIIVVPEKRCQWFFPDRNAMTASQEVHLLRCASAFVGAAYK